MTIYTLLVVVAAIVAGLVIAICTKKDETVTYEKLDKAGQVTNIVLLILYVCLSPLYLFLGLLSYSGYDGLLGVLGWLIAITVASAALPCGVGLGLSVALRKKGKSKPSFLIQFAGMAGILLSLLLFFACYGNLLGSLN